jgi:hypothetical protein
MKRVVLALGLTTLAGCFHILTTEQLVQRSTREFWSVTTEQATEGCAKALETLGYKVTVKDLPTGVIRTAPKSIYVTASGGNGTATLTEDALAWNVQIQPISSGVVVKATPRAYRNGDDITARGLPDIVIDPKFNTLWSEFSSALGKEPIAPPGVAAAPAK